MTTAGKLPPPGIDLADPAFWHRSPQERSAAFARLRRLDAPVFFAEPGRAGGEGSPPGFYALVRHADVVEASRRPEVFISGPGVTTPSPARWVRAVFGDSMVNLDDPRHAQLRRRVSRAFTPRVVTAIEADTRRVAAQVVDAVVRDRPADFVSAVAAPLPFQVICNMMGIPERHRAYILSQIDHATKGTGTRPRWRPRIPGESLRALARLHLLVARVGRQRRREPSDDLISALVTADGEGRHLTGRELGAFFSLLLVAGVETTRNAIAHGLRLLTEHPDQRELLMSDPDRYLPGAVEEIVRYAAPIIQFRRTVAREYELGGRAFSPGDTVVLFYTSANRDEEVFAEPDAFDITRDPNPHLGFGGGGPHFCLGAHLARQEMTVLFRELLTRLPEIRATGPAELVASTFDNRVGRLPFTF